MNFKEQLNQNFNQTLKINQAYDNIAIYTPRGTKQKNTAYFFQQPSQQSSFSLTPQSRLRMGFTDKSEGSQKADSCGPSNGSTILDQEVSHYENIAVLTQNQNQNLKEQNSFLLQKLRKMRERQKKYQNQYRKAKKYKQLWEEAQSQINLLRQECDVYKQEAQQMKKIALIDLQQLKEKVIHKKIADSSNQNFE